MRFIKLGLISVFFLFLIVTLMGLLLPANVVVSRAVDITAPKDSIFKMVADIRQWKQWVTGMNKEGVVISSPTEANLLGTNVKITSTKDYMVLSTWKGKNGTTQESIIRVIQDSTSPKAVAQWQFTEHLKWYPWQRFGSMMNEAVMGSQLETNLANLKKICEQR
ncbi:MAG: hypothetical protein MUE72_03850 [Chitinophagaceae bacterium]|jgi:hypothetical protein|nr:hypothetical protein [Chitinophagaceae bacterium]